jgi:hypothetical protein
MVVKVKFLADALKMPVADETDVSAKRANPSFHSATER